MTRDRETSTREAILHAAGELFAEHGYHGTSSTDILVRSGVARDALMAHFPTKEQIADAVIVRQEEALSVPARDSPLQSAVALSFHYADRIVASPVMRGAVRLAVEQATFRPPDSVPYERPEHAVLTLLLRARERGELLAGADPAAVARLLVGAFTGVQLVSEALTGRRDLTERLADLWHYLLPGLAAPGVLPRLRVPDPGPDDPEDADRADG